MTKFISKENLETYHSLLKPELDKKLDTPDNGSVGQVLTKTDTGIEWSDITPSKKSIKNISGAGTILLDCINNNITIVEMTDNVSGYSFESYPEVGSNHIIIFKAGDTERIVAIPIGENNKTPTGESLEITVPANGYAEVNLLYDGTNIWVRGV